MGCVLQELWEARNTNIQRIVNLLGIVVGISGTLPQI
jgi:hypothetical protein